METEQYKNGVTQSTIKLSNDHSAKMESKLFIDADSMLTEVHTHLCMHSYHVTITITMKLVSLS